MIFTVCVTGGSFIKDTKEELSTEKIKSAEKEAAEEWKKGYNLPVDDQEREEAELECKEMMGYISDIYESAYKGEISNVVLDEKIILEMQKKLMKTNLPVTTSVTYSNMENYESVDSFLEDCMAGKNSSVVIYEIHDDGGISRMKFFFDGTDMYLVSARSVWNENGRAGIAYISNTRIKDWSYTEKGWFGYELCVPEPPEVSEIVDGIYEYFYEMKYGEKFDSEEYPNGIPKEDFESLIMEYIPVTAEQIRDYAVFDEEKQTYDWVRLGCGNYAPTFFGTSLPEVTDIKENDDGTVTLTVDAVCDMVICDDAVITHELAVRFAEDGSFQYLGNEILNDGIKQIPEYQYRISDKET